MSKQRLNINVTGVFTFLYREIHAGHGNSSLIHNKCKRHSVGIQSILKVIRESDKAKPAFWRCFSMKKQVKFLDYSEWLIVCVIIGYNAHYTWSLFLLIRHYQPLFKMTLWGVAVCKYVFDISVRAFRVFSVWMTWQHPIRFSFNNACVCM